VRRTNDNICSTRAYRVVPKYHCLEISERSKSPHGLNRRNCGAAD